MRARRHDLAAALAAALAVLLAGCGTGGTSGGGGSGRPVPSEQGTPIGDPTALALGTAGGVLGSQDGFLVVDVPAGALRTSTPVTVQEITNTAPGGLGSSWLLGPEGTTFAEPVTLTFYVGPLGQPLDELTVAWQDGIGYWHRVPPAEVARNPQDRSLTVRASHFSSWTLTTTPTAYDLTGPFSLSSSTFPPFTATGTATYTFAGEDADAYYYLLSGTITLPSPLQAGSTTCTVTPPETPGLALGTNVGELSKRTPATFVWGASGHWNVTCADGSTQLVTVAFDTEGISFTGCVPVWTTPEATGIDATGGGLTWDCTAKGRGQTSGSWAFQSAACGTACAPTNPCKTGTVTCGSGTAMCTESGNAADGSSCGTNMVCSAGTCVACTAGLACTPANPCDAGVTSCATGTSTCTDTGVPLADGSSCGTDLVCNAGACVACTAGLACTPANPCDVGVTDCSTGTSVCMDTGTTLGDGTSCGTNLTCFAGACISCTQGAACTSTNPCATSSTYECSSGTPVCTDRLFQAAGTSCGTGLVCSVSGTCDTCAAGAACTSANPCATAASISCASGAPACADTAFAPAGTSCGTGLVCSATGQCVACNAGAACTPSNPCLAGTISCSTGVPVCVEGAPLPNGTTCGANQVCSSGVCVACTQGAACTSTNPCDATATIECGTGSPVCTDRSFKTAGTVCGTDLVCSPAGSCISCTQGASCTSTNPCASTATIQCGTGTPVCTDASFVAAGTSCGTNQVCSSGGTCGACTQGAPCTSTNPCAATATTDCTSGSPVCKDATFATDGTSCGSGLTCNGGACVASRTVTATYSVTYWPDTGPGAATAPPNATAAQASALVPDGKGGWASYPGTVSATGAVSIASVPTGAFWLRFQDLAGNVTYLDTVAATPVDLGYDQLGRAGTLQDTRNTTASFTLRLATSWSGNGLDQIQVVCPNVDVWERLSLSSRLTGQTGTWSSNWFLSNALGIPLNLIATSADQATFVHLRSLTDTSNRSYLATSEAVTLTTLRMLQDTAFSLSRTNLATAPHVALPFSGAAWDVASWNAQRAAMNLPAGNGATHMLQLSASRGPLTGNVPVSKGYPQLWSMSLPGTTASTPPIATGLQYAAVYSSGLTATWTQWRGVDFTGSVTFTANGAASGFTESVSVGRRESSTATTALAPTLTPVVNPTFTGTTGATFPALSAATGIGATPRLSWSPPLTGTVTSYTVEIFRLGLSGTATTSARVGTFVTSGTHVDVPSGVLAPGSEYYARITARGIPSDPWSNAPLRRVLSGEWAATLTGKFSP